MRSIAFILALLLASFAAPARADCPQLLKNNEFSGGTIPPWRVDIDSPSVEASVLVTNDTYRTLYLFTGTPPLGSAFALVQPVSIQNGERYRVSFYMVANGPQIAAVEVRSASTPDQTYGLDESFQVSQNPSDATLAFTFTATATDPAAEFAIVFSYTDTYAFKFDSLFMEQVSSPLCAVDGGAPADGSGSATGGTGSGTDGTGSATGATGSATDGSGSASGGTGSGTGSSASTAGTSGSATSGSTTSGSETSGSETSGSATSGSTTSGSAATGANDGGAIGVATADDSGVGHGEPGGGDAGSTGAGGASSIGSDTADTGSIGPRSTDGSALGDASSGPVDASLPDSARAVSCTPGRQVACACAGARSGIQLCNAEGTGYGVCTGCPDAGLGARPSSGGCACDFPTRGSAQPPAAVGFLLSLAGLCRLRRTAARSRRITPARA